MTATIDIETVRLDRGSHTSFDDGVCVMELASVQAGREFSDHPPCVSPVIGSFLRSWNDQLDDEPRQMLKPYAAKVLGTKTTVAAETRRAWLATDWLARECAPAFLRLAGLTAHAETLEGLAALTGTREARTAQPSLAAAWDAAWAEARDAAWDAAEDAVRDAAWDAARAAAGAAAWTAAWAEARDAAWAAARDAAWDAAEAAAEAAARAAARDAAGGAPLAPTVAQLQASALLLLDRMIAA